ncbi:hypothetical protein CRENBAI_007752 [Crenichthys baileyi]|uniref:Uncharacterized protein n=1 Tax=Crenichthys baileyi TaxID=28760 RepID=A0AAV9RLS5_9TELE
MAEGICSEFEESSSISMNILKQDVASFFKSLTEDQWGNLMSGNPDKETKCQLAELLSDVTELLTRTILYNHQSENLTLEDVAAKLGNTVPESFAEVLGVPVEIPSNSSEGFNNLVVSHVMDRIRSYLCCDPDDLTEGYMEQIFDLYKINTMVSECMVMIKEHVITMDKHHLQNTAKEFIPPLVWDFTRRNLHTKSPPSAKNEEKFKQKPKKKGVMRTIKTFISKHILKNSAPPLDYLPENADTENLQKDVLEDLKTDWQSKLNSGIGESIPGDKLSEVGSVKSSENDKNGDEFIQVKSSKNNVDIIQMKPQEQFTHIPSQEIMPEVEPSEATSVKNFKSTNNLSGIIHVKPCNPQQQFTEIVSVEDNVQEDELLDAACMDESDDEISEIPLANNLIQPQICNKTPRECFVAEEDSTEDPNRENFQPQQQFSYTTPVEDFVPETEHLEVTPSEVLAPKENPAELSQVEDFKSEQLPSEATCVKDMVPQKIDPLTPLEKCDQGADVLRESNKTYISLLWGVLMSRAIQKSELNCYSPKNYQLTHKRLFDQICIALARKDIHIHRDSLSKHNKKIFSGLCKKLDCPDELLLSLMFLNFPETDSEIVSSFIKQVSKLQNKPRSFKEALAHLGRPILKLITKKEMHCEESTQISEHWHGESGKTPSETPEFSGISAAGDNSPKDTAQSSHIQENVFKKAARPVLHDPEYYAMLEEKMKAATLRQERRMAVQILVTKLICKIIKRSAKCIPQSECDEIIERLSKQIWDEVEGIIEEMSPKKIERLNRAIFVDLSKEHLNSDMLSLLRSMFYCTPTEHTYYSCKQCSVALKAKRCSSLCCDRVHPHCRLYSSGEPATQFCNSPLGGYRESEVSLAAKLN